MQFWEDRSRGLLIYPTQSPFLQQALPDAKSVNGQYLAVPNNLQNLQVLRYFNHPVPAPITDKTYDFPIQPGRKPLEKQCLMANFLALHRRSFNLSDPGTMKTLAALWAADFIMRMHPKGTFRALIIGTLSTLETVWAKEIFSNFLHRRRFEILHGTAARRIELLKSDVDFYIINHDGVGVGAHHRKKFFELDGFSKELANRQDIQLIIGDEASAYKDSQTKRHRLTRLVIGKRPYLWALTGSPTPTAPTDAYGIAKLVNNAFGKSFTTFRAETMYKPSQSLFKWLPLKDGYDKARQLLSPAIRIDIKEVWDGPPLVPEQRMIPLTDQQKKLMHELKQDLQLQMTSGDPISAVNEAAARTKFLQICLGAVYDQQHNIHLVDADPRYSECEQVIEETTRKVVIFVGLTSVVDLLYKRLSKRWSTGILNGHTPLKERPHIIRSFGEEHGGLRVVICDPQTTAHGINEFVTGDTAVWFGPTEKAELYDQGNKRIRRPGQKYPTRAVQLVSTPLEKEIFRRLENNLTLQGSMLELIRKGEI